MSNLFPSTITIDQGRNLQFTVVWQDDAGTPINLTGYTAAFAIASGYNQTPLISLSVGSGITITALTGTIAISCSAALTDTLTGSGYVAELVLTSASGVETSLLKGYIPTSSKVVP
jgi:hypothetical protein